MSDYDRPNYSDLKARIEVDLTDMPAVLRKPIAAAVARGHHSAHGHIKYADDQSSPLRCSEERLAEWAALYNVERLLATFALGVVLANGTAGVTVLKSRQLRGSNGLDYEVVAAVPLGAGPTPVLARCLTAGTAGNLSSGDSLTFIDPAAGVSSTVVVAADGITGGAEEEAVDAWRVRVCDEWQTVVSQGARGGRPDDYKFWARSAHPSVTTALVLPHALGIGTVVVMPLCNSLPNRLPSPAVLEAVRASYEGTVVATADWRLGLATPRPVTVGILLAAAVDTSVNRAAIQAAVDTLVMSKQDEESVIQMAELDAAIATVTTQYTRIAPTADVTAAKPEVLNPAPIVWH